MSTLKTNTIIPVSGGILSVSGGLSAGDCTANGVSAGTAYFSRGVTVASPLFVSGGATFSASTNFTGNVTALGLAIGQSTAPETGISFEINGPSRHDVPIQPTVSADTNSIVYRDVLMVAQTQGTGWVSGGTAGALVIVAPKSWSNTMLRLEIDGFDYSSDTGGWGAVVSGYNYTGSNSWVTNGRGQYIEGTPPFSQIRLGYHDTLGKVCFILGESSTTWAYPKVHIKSVSTSLQSTTGWGHGWTAYWEANAALPGISAGSVVNCTPKGNTRLRNGNFGIGTTAPADTLDVNGGLRASGGVNFSSSTASTSTTTGALVVAGGVGVGGGVNVGGGVTAARVSVTNTTASTGTTTGALVVTGGVGVGGALTVGGTFGIGGGTAAMSVPLGSAPLFAARAWGRVIVSGTAISTQTTGNCSVTRVSTGVYKVTFTTAMNSSNYAVITSSETTDGTVGSISHVYMASGFTPTANDFHIKVSAANIDFRDKNFYFVVME